MANKREARTVIADYNTLIKQHDEAQAELEKWENLAAESKSVQQTHGVTSAQIKREIDRWRNKRDALKRDMLNVGTAYDIEEVGEKTKIPERPEMPEAHTAYDVPEKVAGVGETKIPERPSPGAINIPGEGAGYDINIGIGEGGELIAPESMTAEQIAVMIPGAFGASTPSQIKEATEGPSRPTAPPGDRPPEGFRPTSYKDRERFENNVFDEIGFNPILFNPYDHVNQSMSELPQLFMHVFDGRIMWADRNKLSKKELAHWMSIVKMFRANKLREASELKTRGMNMYNWMMNKFDYAAKQKEATLKELRAAPTTRELWSDKKGTMTLHEWNAGRREWVDTGKIAKAEKPVGMPPHVKDAWNIVRSLANTYGGQDIGEAPAVENEAVSKYPLILNLLGEAGQRDPKLKELYESQLDIVMGHFGLTEKGAEAPAPAAGGETKTYTSKTGKTFTVTIRKSVKK